MRYRNIPNVLTKAYHVACYIMLRSMVRLCCYGMAQSMSKSYLLVSAKRNSHGQGDNWEDKLSEYHRGWRSAAGLHVTGSHCRSIISQTTGIRSFSSRLCLALGDDLALQIRDHLEDLTLLVCACLRACPHDCASVCQHACTHDGYSRWPLVLSSA